MEQDFLRYFPNNLSPEIKRTLSFHVLSLDKCIGAGLYFAATTHIHLIYMLFVYLQIYRIAIEKENEFKLVLVGFPDQEAEYAKSPHPFTFAKINEKTIFRFFKILDFDNGFISNISSVVNSRNKRLHISEVDEIASQEEYFRIESEYLGKIHQIEEKQVDFLDKRFSEIFETFEDDYVFTDDDFNLSFGSFSEYEIEILYSRARNEYRALKKLIEQKNVF